MALCHSFIWFAHLELRWTRSKRTNHFLWQYHCPLMRNQSFRFCDNGDLVRETLVRCIDHMETWERTPTVIKHSCLSCSCLMPWVHHTRHWVSDPFYMSDQFDIAGLTQKSLTTVLRNGMNFLAKCIAKINCFSLMNCSTANELLLYSSPPNFINIGNTFFVMLFSLHRGQIEIHVPPHIQQFSFAMRANTFWCTQTQTFTHPSTHNSLNGWAHTRWQLSQ